ncbi:AbrB/MazE/SpoVT family DNA-binding domain-containing protein [Rhizobium sp. S152]|uniref:AbrB/MazE/SpoVT family DNA-binding domain-containing protein n=1 Tax=Rhizobium sp. S152 TaxID=3055038 RepID=UPI0025A9D80D|nr:AbrB/MazE/SpoVT family DNA-binding domain-containing protein [Rhizobium sp. S152]MDM9629639.1 AbrB/MazE/SpoVT family DNA-binding domain-containing protein [Rhizobium sp. S152]
MARVKMSDAGTVELPKAVRDAHGFKAGVEFEVTDDGQRIFLDVVPTLRPTDEERKLTIDEFLAFVRSFPKYEGPPVTDEMMHEAINQAAIEDWERLERQWADGAKDDHDKDG